MRPALRRLLSHKRALSYVAAGALSAALRTRLEELRLRYDELSEALSADVRPCACASAPRCNPAAGRRRSALTRAPAVQPPLPLDRIVAINKELGQLSPIMDAFVAVSKLEDVRESRRLALCAAVR